MEIFLIAVGAVLLNYFVMREAIIDGIKKTILKHSKVQSAILRFQAKQAGMTDEEIDKAFMEPKQLNKKYPK